MDVVERARVFATAAHSAVGQTRKYTFEPYIVHPAEIVGILKTVEHTEEMLAAAWLHDVVEDTGVEVTDIWREFGAVVASYVNWLTNKSKLEDGNRAHRKEIDREHIRNAPAEVKTIKCADVISNMTSIAEHDKEFAKTYLKETGKLLEVLDGADPSLLGVAHTVLKECNKILRH